MYDRIIEIIVYVMSEIKTINKLISEIDFGNLETLGYSQSEISAALSWILDTTESKNKFNIVSAPNSAFPLRILNESESEIFTPAAWSELNNYVMLGVISYEQLEFVIERFLIMNIRRIESDSINPIIADLLFSQALSVPNSPQVILHGFESVN
jgi:uncharacterized protein Smg (DUF494 family)